MISLIGRVFFSFFRRSFSVTHYEVEDEDEDMDSDDFKFSLKNRIGSDSESIIRLCQTSNSIIACGLNEH